MLDIYEYIKIDLCKFILFQIKIHVALYNPIVFGDPKQNHDSDCNNMPALSIVDGFLIRERGGIDAVPRLVFGLEIDVEDVSGDGGHFVRYRAGVRGLGKGLVVGEFVGG